MAEITQEVENLIKSELRAKVFSTGSKGFFASGKIRAGEDKFQAQAMAVLIGSKDQPRVKVAGAPEEAVAVFTELVRNGLPPTTFRSGKTGYRAQGRAEIHGQKFQLSVQAVRLA